jgi:hypothetical protein
VTDKTRVYFTVDVECAEERVRGSRVQPAMGYDLRVWGRFRNQARELGLRPLLDRLEAHGCRGTFFMEPLGARHFGQENLAETCGELRRRGHDVQLHLHPVQRDPRWHSEGRPRLSDDMAGYGEDEQVALLEEGLSRLTEAGVPRESLVAFRAGNFGADDATWQALRRARLLIDSSYNPYYLDGVCRMHPSRTAPGLFPSPVAGVWELPVTCFVEQAGPPTRYRHLQITAVSLAEMIHALEQCRALGIGEVTIVTHSFEFCFIDSPENQAGRPNGMTLRRLEGLLQYLERHAAEFEVETVGDLGRRLPSAPVWPPSTELPRGRAGLRYRRYLDQGYKRIAAWRP